MTRRILATAAATVLVLTACGADGTDDDGADTGAEETAEGQTDTEAASAGDDDAADDDAEAASSEEAASGDAAEVRAAIGDDLDEMGVDLTDEELLEMVESAGGNPDQLQARHLAAAATTVTIDGEDLETMVVGCEQVDPNEVGWGSEDATDYFHARAQDGVTDFSGMTIDVPMSEAEDLLWDEAEVDFGASGFHEWDATSTSIDSGDETRISGSAAMEYVSDHFDELEEDFPESFDLEFDIVCPVGE